MPAIGEKDRKWHIGKEVSIATIIVLIVQTITVIWWAATTSTKVDFLKESISSMRTSQSYVDKKQDEDSLRAETRISAQFTSVNDKLDRLIEKK